MRSMHFFECKAQPYGLKSTDIDTINKILDEGGLCILPSDSSYILTGLLTQHGITEDLDTLLDRHGMRMSLAFGSLEQATGTIDLSCMAQNFIKELSPNGLTFVASPTGNLFQQFSKSRLHADGTVGMRLTRSMIETQLAKKFPLPSTPIRDTNGREILTSEAALHIIMERMDVTKINRPIALVDGVVPYPGQLSTVVKEEKRDGLWHLIMIRENAIPFGTIQRVALTCHYAGVIVRQE